MAIDGERGSESKGQLEELRSRVYEFAESIERGDAAVYRSIPSDDVEGFIRAVAVLIGAGEQGSLLEKVKYILDAAKREAELRADFEAASASLDERRAEINWTDGRIVEVEVEPAPQEPYVWRDTVVTMNSMFRDEIAKKIEEAAHGLDPLEHPNLIVSLLALVPLIASIPESRAPRPEWH